MFVPVVSDAQMLSIFICDMNLLLNVYPLIVLTRESCQTFLQIKNRVNNFLYVTEHWKTLNAYICRHTVSCVGRQWIMSVNKGHLQKCRTHSVRGIC